MQIKHILFPYDFSAQGSAAVPFVRAMAAQFGARVTILSVVPPIWDLAIGEPSTAHTVEVTALKGRLDGALQTEFAGLQVDRVVQQGDPAAMIVDYAHSHMVDLIMMPTHGRGPFRMMLLGSVTAKVLHDARCPVWTAPHIDEPEMRERAGAVKLKSIVCGVDENPRSAVPLRWAADFAASTSAELRVVHAVQSVTDIAWVAGERELQETARLDEKAAVETLLAAEGVKAPVDSVVGAPSDVLREGALKRGADVIVIGRGVLHETFGRLRTNVMSIIRWAPCPVISV